MATLKQALEKIDLAVEAYRSLLRDSPQDYEEAARRQQEAAEIFSDAQELGGGLSDKDYEVFQPRFAEADEAISEIEAKRIAGFDDGEGDDPGTDDEEPDGDDTDAAETYSSMAQDPDEDEDEDSEDAERLVSAPSS